VGLANQNVSVSNAVELGNNSPTVELNNRPTLIVSRSTAEPATKSISLSGFQVVNFIAGVNAIVQSATLTKTASYLFINTQPYVLAFGAPIKFQFDGTNLT